ncbi:helix-turn-helix transcriptional regulator [Paenibacillus arenilitoris]|uniref:Helix-turn-helix transcriptional regulator n=1 Tax=Paenibacillus arenilitoris TaxID=2772299 RepID=A0A927CI39_9BACL|nr:AraC family transcriptional regulator [Paenibacillus arenilitoris]MBD2867924.1 helix-turn-helix transcriptional regulator [Paenibacillus arenilitoris]
MNTTLERILQNQLNHIHAEVIMSAYTESSPGWSEHRAEPDFYRFCYTDKGMGWLDINDKRHVFKPETLYLLPARTMQSFGTEGGDPFCFYWCHFRMEHSDTQFIQALQLPPFVCVRNGLPIRQLFAKMIDAQQSSAITRELRLKAVLLELIAFYLDESKIQHGKLTEPNFGVKWDELLDYIEENLHTGMQVEELARFAYLHPNYFISTFKSVMGCSPIQYVTNRRIAAAKRLLAETKLPVAAVAKHVGMQNHYLSRLFKRYTGITPVQYRRIACLGQDEAIRALRNEEEGRGH